MARESEALPGGRLRSARAAAGIGNERLLRFSSRILCRGSRVPAAMSHRWPSRRILLQLLLAAAFPLPARAQAQIPEGTPDPGGAPEKRPGRYRLGPLYLTPRFRVGPVGFDSNVYYTPVDRQADVTLALGPGLDVVWPFGGARFSGGGGLDYLFFARTVSQRRLTGFAYGGLAARGGRTEASLEERYQSLFNRPSYEIDQRISQTTEGTKAEVVRRLFGRTSLGVEGGRERTETSEAGDYLGTPIAPGLTTNSYIAASELEVGLSVKTNVVARAEWGWNRFPLDPSRDSDLRLVAGGLRTDPTALISGQALVGRRYYRPVSNPNERQTLYVDVEAMLHISSRTHLGGGYHQDLQDSFFVPADGVPALLSRAVSARIEKSLTSRVDLVLFGRRTRYVTEAPITVIPPEEDPVTSVRDDVTREVGANLSYRFRKNFRIGVQASYVDRDATIAYYGVQGLVVGVNAQVDP